MTSPMVNTPLSLSILDLAVVGDGAKPADALRETAALAESADRWGYHRYWVAEHHSFPASATSSPAVLLSHLGHRTSRIRLGSGGVMLTNHAPLVVAEQFGVLDAFLTGRVDLGVGRASGTLPAMAQALERSPDDSPEAFSRRVSDLLGFLGRGFPADHPYAQARVFAMPPASGVPVWMLGSGATGAQIAASFGLPFVAALHINAAQATAAIDQYRSTFRPSVALSKPYVMVSVTAVCADTEQAALRIARPGALGRLFLSRGDITTIPTAEAAENYDYTADEKRFVNGSLDDAVVGSPSVVRERLEELQKRTAADELMLTAMISDFQDRSRSFELIAEEVQLS
ncbi:LLM class flavin-dependent oxidoreductase [Actinoplanes sp. NPDC049596]|uniref:LLM class flavin-dependent oxidoreductase n=1 Tax=unclassified Actinoplanes TaxID=2626549 RepID=UPI00342AEE11